ncbi:conserved protein of unknown function [Candidatus Bipolaricaulis anaerobius]|jgi:general stress protein 26|uniref:Pyridoxamine 5'-phosphate oxidase N-terminal domain-containing protein n=1 Tax=Candidatus Bipolaricaulis anaerobius TaxID=2026885 RepID=A0A2X3L142_9BACT|nr:pyridoxamine 5'-phosphate oxidase family protein [Candidatus Bipolaricaulis anaerobius]SQD92500.1 conserved protein of unknown function [Candidatus Bipolaricaulis anaerobius]
MTSSERQKIVEIIKEIEPAYLATCEGHQPRVRPVSPIVEGDMSIWVGTRGTSRKVKQIEQNPKVCLTFVQPPHSAKGEKVAIVIGEAKQIQNLEEKKRFWRLWTQVYPAFDLSRVYPNGPESNDFCLLKIIVKKIEWWAEKEPMKLYEPEKVESQDVV